MQDCDKEAKGAIIIDPVHDHTQSEIVRHVNVSRSTIQRVYKELCITGAFKHDVGTKVRKRSQSTCSGYENHIFS